jgi:hypothetical protein
MANVLGEIDGLAALFDGGCVGGLALRHESHDFTSPSAESGFASVAGTVGTHGSLLVSLAKDRGPPLASLSRQDKPIRENIGRQAASRTHEQLQPANII